MNISFVYILHNQGYGFSKPPPPNIVKDHTGKFFWDPTLTFDLNLKKKSLNIGSQTFLSDCLGLVTSKENMYNIRFLK